MCPYLLRLLERSFPGKIFELGIANMHSPMVASLSRLGLKEFLLLLLLGARGCALGEGLFEGATDG